MLSSYYQAFYLAKGGIDIGIATASKNIYGSYKYESSTQSGIVGQTACNSSCQLSLSIDGDNQHQQDNFRQYSGCTQGLTLTQGQIHIQPLFIWSASGGLSSYRQDTQITNIRPQRTMLWLEQASTTASIPHVILGFLAASGDILDNNAVVYRDYMQFDSSQIVADFFTYVQNYINTISQGNLEVLDSLKPDKQHYLIVANADTKPLNICISTSAPKYNWPILELPGQQSYIRSTARHKDYQVSLEAIVNNKLPQYVSQTYIPF